MGMAEKPLNQSSPRRAWEDTKESFHKMWFFWSVQVVAVGAFAILGAIFTPENAGSLASAIRPVAGGAVGAVVGFGIIYLICLIKAPYRQRDEARHALEKLSQTPLVVECNSYERQLVGETWLKEKQYIWFLDVILTNQSDTQNVSTKAVSLVVNFPVADGDIRRYALSLVPDIDKDKYGRPSAASGELLAENEYLKPRESLRGFYQFLDKDTFWKSQSIQTWPMLVVVDSFGAPHRREFNRPRFAIQSNLDKQDSQAK